MAHFERVVYGLKNFDLVLVLKDFSQKPLQINSINMEHLEPLKSWLDSCNIKFYEGTANLNWNSIMKHVNDIGLEGFYDDGGWKFLNMQGSSDEEEEESEAVRCRADGARPGTRARARRRRRRPPAPAPRSTARIA